MFDLESHTNRIFGNAKPNTLNVSNLHIHFSNTQTQECSSQFLSCRFYVPFLSMCQWLYLTALRIVISERYFHAKYRFSSSIWILSAAHTSLGTVRRDINTNSRWKSISVDFCHKVQKHWKPHKIKKRWIKIRAQLSAHTLRTITKNTRRYRNGTRVFFSDS